MTSLIDPITHIILSPSPPAAISFMAQHRHSFSQPERLWFFHYGTLPTPTQIHSLLQPQHKKKIILLYEDDLLGRITAIKIACWLKRRAVQLTYTHDETVHIRFNDKTYLFPEHELSLSRFEKRTGLRSQIKTYKLQSPELD